MDLARVSEDNESLYAPAHAVFVDGTDLTTEALLTVSQVEVDLALRKAGRFSFTIVHSYDHELRQFRASENRSVFEVLKFGAAVEIFMGYGSTLTRLVSGIITEVCASYAESGTPEVTISGSDNLFPLTLGKKTFNWRNRRDSDIVLEIAARHNLSVTVDRTEPERPQVEQNQESDLDFINKLAERNHFEVYMDDASMLHFQAPNADRDGVLTLSWGTDLLSFKPQANMGMQVSRVEVYGWDEKRKQAIVGSAGAGNESGRDAQRRSGPDRLTDDLRIDPVLRLRRPVSTQAEADTHAKAVLSDMAKQFLTADGESLGIATLRPDTNITLAALGAPFSKTYYLEQTVHKSDTNGYRTRFKVKEPTL